MSAAYALERAYRTEEGLKFGDGTLRERLPASRENGIGCIGRGGIVAISPDLGAELGALKKLLDAGGDDEIGPARAAITEMRDREVAVIARRVDDLCARIEDAAAQGQG